MLIHTIRHSPRIMRFRSTNSQRRFCRASAANAAGVGILVKGLEFIAADSRIPVVRAANAAI
ncbi:hypothetical protein MishRS11D_04810 [Methylomagnum ishizawai]|nr:hypothetical protein MishRS11D_04810 [Methylomagnum ishizawai]